MSDTPANGEKTPNPNYGCGYLEISEKGFGFLRTAQNHFHPKPTDIFVTPDTI
ncbi:MAG: transcription termination factor Rho, partial [Verrucomicrobiota bacterium]